MTIIRIKKGERIILDFIEWDPQNSQSEHEKIYIKTIKKLFLMNIRKHFVVLYR